MKSLDTLIRGWGSFLAFAEEIGVDVRYLHYVRSGEKFPSREVIQKMADALGLPPKEMFAILDSLKNNSEKVN